jgi:hypothetical protein
MNVTHSFFRTAKIALHSFLAKSFSHIYPLNINPSRLNQPLSFNP